jgi:hydroxypyruvate reductase
MSVPPAAMTSPASIPIRDELRLLLDRAIATAQPGVCLPAHLPMPTEGGRVIVLGAGKAAAAMAQAAEAHYEAAGLRELVGGMVTTRHGYALPTRWIEVGEAAHPVPDASSIANAERALRLAAEAGPRDLVLVLLSGGASALWAAPAEGVTLADKQALTRALLRSGAPIGSLNAVRKHVSRIKGGRLTRAAAPAPVVTLAVSDVIGDDPATIGSGPTVADPTTLADARAELVRFGVTPEPPIARALADATNETPKPGDATFASSRYTVVATARQSLEAAAEAGRQLGYEVAILGDDFEGEAREVAAEHARQALAARRRNKRVLLLSGGELTVTVTGKGRGGRNQEFALALAMALDGAPGITALAAGTDGADGGTGAADDPAGAIVDSSTLARAAALNLSPAAFLADNDSGGFFERLGDLVVTGPTQTNVNDFRAIVVEPQ